MMYRTALTIILALSLTTAALGRPPVTSLNPDGAALDGQGMVAATAITGETFSVRVDGQSFTFWKPVMVAPAHPGQTVLFGRNSAYAVEPATKNGNFLTTVVPYLLKSPQFQDALKLRRLARHIRAKELPKVLAPVVKNAQQLAAITEYVKQSVGTPLIVVDRAPLPEYIRKPGAGPCNITSGAALVESNRTVFSDANVICISDLISSKGDKVIFSVADSISNDTLDVVLCHETAHAIMNDLYGRAYATMKRPSTVGHSAPVITDLALAWIEGWAEAFEAIYGPSNPTFTKAERERLRISEFLFERQDPVRRERYIWETLVGRPTGVLKNGLQLLCTEGVIAGVLYDIMTSRAITAPTEKILTTMARTVPKSFRQFMHYFLQHNPGDRRVLLRIFLENTNYGTMSHEATRLYTDYYRKKLEYQKKKLPREAFLAAKNAFVSFKEDLFRKAMNGADIFANVGPEMWFSGLVVSSKPRPLEIFEKAQLEARKQMGMDVGKFDPNRWEFNLDLNIATDRMLRRVGIPSDVITKILAARAEKGFFTGSPVAQLQQFLGKERFAEWQKRLAVSDMEGPAKKSPAAHLMTLYPEDLDL